MSQLIGLPAVTLLSRHLLQGKMAGWQPNVLAYSQDKNVYAV